MSLLVQGSSLQVIPTLAVQVGLNEAIILQQLHFRLLISENERDGHKWVYKTYDEWQVGEFPFWSVDTIKRAIRRLEEKGYIIATSSYNRMKMDKTKCYRINYEKLEILTMQDAPLETAQIAEEEVQSAPPAKAELAEGEMQNISQDACILPLAITKELKELKRNKKDLKDIVEQDLDVVAVIDYLNTKANKQFKASSKATARLVKGRIRDGYKLADFQKVIDTKVIAWENHPRWQTYLRPSTLFNATNFENYLEESRSVDAPVKHVTKPFELDFSKGEA